MSGRVVSADTNSSRRREFVYPIQYRLDFFYNIAQKNTKLLNNRSAAEIFRVYIEL